METLLVKAMQRAKYYVAGTVQEQQRQHFALNIPLYTHFTNPSRRYADIVVHRQLTYPKMSDPDQIPTHAQPMQPQLRGRRRLRESVQEKGRKPSASRLKLVRCRPMLLKLSLTMTTMICQNSQR